MLLVQFMICKIYLMTIKFTNSLVQFVFDTKPFATFQVEPTFEIADGTDNKSD